jgi:hypothetical protein
MDNNKQFVEEREVMDAFDRLARDNSPENRKRFQDRYRDHANDKITDTKRGLQKNYRRLAREADSPQVDIETPDGFDDFLNGGTGQ